jgi:phosphoglycerol transferase MdoB-like AlkP superfamily enzyme
MRKKAATIALALAWLAAHAGFFVWYHRLLGVEAAGPAVFVAGIVGTWLFFMATGRGAFFRILAHFLYGGLLLWALVNFAYFRVFNGFLPIFSTRLNSLNGAVLKQVGDYHDLVPVALVAAAVALAALFAVAGWAWRRQFATVTVSVSLVPGREQRVRTGRRAATPGWRGVFAAVGLQAAVMMFMVAGLGAVRYQLDRDGLGTDEVAERLGLMAHAFAGERRISAEEAEAALAAVPSAGLGAARSHAEVVREAMSSLASADAAASPSGKPSFATPPHVIMYQLESVAAWPLLQDPSPMPFLASFMASSGSVGEYYANGCTTIDAELSVNCGALPESYGPVSDLYAKNRYLCLPTLLQRLGYRTFLYHANEASFWSRETLAPAWGFQSLRFTPDFSYRSPDSALLDAAVDEIEKATGPTYSYVIGLTSHGPHNRHFLDFYNDSYGLGMSPYAEPLSPSSQAIDVDEATKRYYLGYLRAVDDGLRHIFERLERDGLADKVVVAVFADHRYYVAKDAGAAEAYRLSNRLPFVLHAPGLGARTLAPVASHIDLAPTIYDLVTGGTGNLPSTFVGTSLFSPAHPAVAVNKCLGQVSALSVSGGRTRLAVGDMRSDSFRTVVPSGDAAADTAAEGQLRLTALVSDLLLKRDEFGEGGESWSGPAAGRIELDNVTDGDGDGLSDLRERALGTSSKNPDTDGDGVPDGVEVEAGTNPLGEGRWVREEGISTDRILPDD